MNKTIDENYLVSTRLIGSPGQLRTDSDHDCDAERSDTHDEQHSGDQRASLGVSRRVERNVDVGRIQRPPRLFSETKKHGGRGLKEITLRCLPARCVEFVTILVVSVAAAAADLPSTQVDRALPLMGLPVMTGLTLVRPRVVPAPAPASTYSGAYRTTLKSVSPLADEALQVLEVRRGVRYSDSEIPAVSRTPEFQVELDRARQRFCTNAANSATLACSPASSVSAPQPLMRAHEDDVVRTARKTLSGNEEVIAPQP